MTTGCRVTRSFSPLMIRLHRSWSWARSDFAEEFERLSAAGAFQPGGPSQEIWNTGNKFVLRVETQTGYPVAYKSFFRIKNIHQYWLRPSLSAAEAINYLRLQKIGLPLPDLLATGEIRRGFVLKNSFIVTRFIEGFRDGRDFYKNGMYANDVEKCMEYCRGHLRLLAKLHDAGLCHRGFIPANLMYREEPDGMKFCWVDVAECRRWVLVTPQRIAMDMVNMFRMIKVSAAIRRELETVYLEAASKRRTNIDELSEMVEQKLVERLKK